MAFPWELNLDRPYHDEKPYPDRRAGGKPIDSVLGGSAEKLDELPADSQNRRRR